MEQKDRTMNHELIEAARQLNNDVSTLVFSNPVAYVYNPLDYAWEPYKLYLERYGAGRKRVIFLGMNPGPWGMAQTGVPFGEIQAAKEWLGIEGKVKKPRVVHPKRPVMGFACTRVEVSGKRLWGLFKERFGNPVSFFNDHFIANYCPLVFMEESGKNRTPDKLKPSESKPLYSVCDRHLKEITIILQPEWVIGVGRFSEMCAQRALDGMDIRIGQILHPSPASPAANRDWAKTVTRQLMELGVW